MNKEQLLEYLRKIRAIEKQKQAEIRARENIPEDVGFLVKETFLIAKYVPKMIEFGITPEDLE